MPLAFALSVAAAIAYVLVWSLLECTSGCGPPGHSTARRIFSAAPAIPPGLDGAQFACLAGGLIDNHSRIHLFLRGAGEQALCSGWRIGAPLRLGHRTLLGLPLADPVGLEEAGPAV